MAEGAQSEFSRRHGHWVASSVLAVLLFVFFGVVSAFYIYNTTARVEGPSMEPSLLPHDIVLVSRGYTAPVRGDIVVIDAPPSPHLAPGSRLVKRVVAVGGDRVAVRDGQAVVNGTVEQGAYTVYVATADISMREIIVPGDSIFVLGDNRPASSDSRIFGPVPEDLIVGRVTAVIAPINRMRIVP